MTLAGIDAPAAPPPGGVAALADGLFWTRLPLPGPLRFANAFVLDDGDGWTLVDCGSDTADGRDAWDAVLAGPLSGRAVRRILLTHGHHDHAGLAGYLSRRLDAPVHASRGEAEVIRRRGGVGERRDDLAAFYRRLGCPDDEADALADGRLAAATRLSAPPSSFEDLADGSHVRAGGRIWRVAEGPGHSPAHLTFHAKDDGLLIVGDSLLPKITPFVGVEADDPLADPLGAFLDTLAALATLPAGTVALPGHGSPLSDPSARAREISTHHAGRLDRFAGAMPSGTVRDHAVTAFPRAMASEHARLALAETLAHLNRLAAVGRLVRHDGNVLRFAIPANLQ